MGSKQSKEPKASGSPQQRTGSAPSRLEGLDGTSPPHQQQQHRRQGGQGGGPATPDMHLPTQASAPAAVPTPQPQTQPHQPQQQPLKEAVLSKAPSLMRPGFSPATPSPDHGKRGLSIDLQHSKSNRLGADAAAEALSPVAASPAAAITSEPPSPTNRRAPKKFDVVGQQTDGTMLAADLPAATQIPSDFKHWIPVLGESVARNLHSADWKTREHALQSVMRNVSTTKWQDERLPSKVWACIAEMLAIMLKDKVAPLFHAALELLAQLVSTYAAQVPRSMLTAGLDPIVPTLLHRAGNNNGRIQESAIQALLTLASQPALGLAYLAPLALEPIPKKAGQGASASSAAHHQMAGRLELLTCMLNMEAQQRLGISFGSRTAAARGPKAAEAAGQEQAGAGAAGPPVTALPTAALAAFCRPALEMPDDKVRQGAVRLVAELYRRHKLSGGGEGGEATAAVVFDQEGLCAGLKPAMLQVLHRRFAEVDAELRPGGSGGGRPGVAGSAPALSTSHNLDDVPVGASIKVNVPRGLSHLPPLPGVRNASALPPIVLMGVTGRGPKTPEAGGLPSRPPLLSSSSMHATGPASPVPFGRPPRTPVPVPAAGGSPSSTSRARTPTRTSRQGGSKGSLAASEDASAANTSPGRRGPGTPPRPPGSSGPSSFTRNGSMAAALLPGALPDSELDAALVISSNPGSPARPGGLRSGSLKARTQRGPSIGGPEEQRVFDDAEERIIEYILNDEIKDNRY